MVLEFLQHYKKRIFFIGTIAISLGIGWGIFYTVAVFHVTSVSPNPSGLSYLTPQLVVGFNKKVTNDDIAVSLNDTQLKTSTNNNELVITLPDDLAGNANYTITIKNVSSKEGDLIKNHTIKIKTELNTKSLSDAEKKILLDRQQADKPSIINDPIFSHVPYSTLDYSLKAVVYNANTKFQSVTVVIKIPLSAADAKIDRNGAIDRYKSEAINYLKSFSDLNLDSYTIEVNVVEPTL